MPSARPTYVVMICHAITFLKDRNGSSRQAIKRYIEENFGEVNQPALRKGFRKGVDDGDLIQNGQRFKAKQSIKDSIRRKANRKTPAPKKKAAAKKKKATKKRSKSKTKKPRKKSSK